VNNNLRRVLQKQCRKSIGSFEERVLHSTPWASRSILMSEGFAFCAVANLLSIDMIFESGIHNGRSTQMWANYFPSHTLIFAIEKRSIRDVAYRRLVSYENVSIIKGDGPSVITDLLPKFPERRVGIFIDGPKDTEAVEFAKRIILLPNVAVVAIHDMSVTQGRFQVDCSFGRKGELYYQEGRIEFDKWELGQFLTDEEWFIKEYSWLDKDESHLDVKQRLTWHPYKFIGAAGPDRELGSYGPTIGFAFKQEDADVG